MLKKFLNIVIVFLEKLTAFLKKYAADKNAPALSNIEAPGSCKKLLTLPPDQPFYTDFSEDSKYLNHLLQRMVAEYHEEERRVKTTGKGIALYPYLCVN